jgi:hypothetical protein
MAKTAVRPARRVARPAFVKPMAKAGPYTHPLPSHKISPQGSSAFHTVLMPSGTHTDLGLVTVSADKLAKMIGKTAAQKIKGPAFKLSRQLMQSGYALAVVPVPKKELEQVVGAVNDEPAAGAWDPYEAGRQAVEALKQADGGAVDRNEAAQRLDIGLAQLYNRIKEKKVVTWVDAAGRYQFPRWQFGANGLLPGIQDCLQILAGSDAWAIMRFFLTPSESAGDVPPVHLLRTNRIEEAKKIAAVQAAHG